MELQPWHFHGVWNRDHDVRCYIQHYPTRQEKTVDDPTKAQFEISTVKVEAPEFATFYKDQDDDLFMWLGSNVDPWLQFGSSGAYGRQLYFPAEPLIKLTGAEFTEALKAKQEMG